MSDKDEQDRPDLELERLVMQDCMGPGHDPALDDRPAAGWVVREDVVRGAVELITALFEKAEISHVPTPLLLSELCKRDPNGCSDSVSDLLAGQALDGMQAARERDDLRDQVEALVAQLEEEERTVVRWRERIERAPKMTAELTEAGGLYVLPNSFSAPRLVGERVRVAIVRLDGHGVADAEHTEGSEA
jgi:hypothetical protein